MNENRDCMFIFFDNVGLSLIYYFRCVKNIRQAGIILHFIIIISALRLMVSGRLLNYEWPMTSR